MPEAERELTNDEKLENLKTMDHIACVHNVLHKCITALQERALVHDQSKLQNPEVEGFTDANKNDNLNKLTYGSPEYYKQIKDNLGPALKHHYENNSHHPEHFEDGLKGMNLLDLIEMICDWKAATLRHADGNIYKSLVINQGRFGIESQLYDILFNTIDFIEGENNSKNKSEKLNMSPKFYYKNGKKFEQTALNAGWKLEYKQYDGIILPECWEKQNDYSGDWEYRAARDWADKGGWDWIDPDGKKIGRY